MLLQVIVDRCLVSLLIAVVTGSVVASLCLAFDGTKISSIGIGALYGVLIIMLARGRARRAYVLDRGPDRCKKFRPADKDHDLRDVIRQRGWHSEPRLTVKLGILAAFCIVSYFNIQIARMPGTNNAVTAVSFAVVAPLLIFPILLTDLEITVSGSEASPNFLVKRVTHERFDQDDGSGQ